MASLLLFQILLALKFHLASAGDFCLTSPEGHQCCFNSIEEKNEIQNLLYQAANESCIYVTLVHREWRKQFPYLPLNLSFEIQRKAILWSPSYSTPIDVTATRFWVFELSMDEPTQEIYMEGYINLLWHDPRLTWQNDFSFNSSVTINASGDRIWNPVLRHSSNNWKDLLDNQYNAFSNDGVVVHGVKFHLYETCPFDYTRYPFDEHECCINLVGGSNRGANVSFNVDTDVGTYSESRVRRDRVSRLWKGVTAILSTNVLAIGYDPSPGQNLVYSACVKFRRGSATATNEVVLPAAVTILLSLFLPMFSSWKYLVISKVFCLGLQFACSFVLTLDTEHLQFGDTTPNVLRLHELLIWTTTLSLLCTCLLQTLAKRDFFLPPASLLIKVTTFANTYLWWALMDVPEGDDSALEHSEGMKSTPAVTTASVSRNGQLERVESGDAISVSLQGQESMKQRQDTWNSVWLGFARVIQTVFICVYVMGSLCLIS